MPRNIKIVKDPQKIKVGIEETRSKILTELGTEGTSVKELADEIDRDPSTIYRHIHLLEDAGYVERCMEEETELDERLYRKAAGIFLMAPKKLAFEELSESDVSPTLNWDDEEKIRETLERLKILGFENDMSDELVSDISDYIQKIYSELNQIIHDDVDLAPLSYPDLLMLKIMIYLIRIRNDEEFEREGDRIFSDFEYQG